MLLIPKKIPFLQEIRDPLFARKEIRFLIKREDVIHPQISGNKWHKLKYNLEEAKSTGHDTLLTFGGSYSNHIYAMAAAAKEVGFACIGVIRGGPVVPLNPTLQFAVKAGMRLHFVTREKYRVKTEASFIADLKQKFGPFYLIPEGGTNQLAVKGATEIIDESMGTFDYICCPVGTGGTIAGIVCGLHGRSKVIGFPVLKGDFLGAEVKKLVKEYSDRFYHNWYLMQQYHFGGYAKFTRKLIHFINAFREQHSIALDPVYTGKMMYGIFDQIRKGFFKKGSKIIAIHTGGLQGIAGFNERFGELLI